MNDEITQGRHTIVDPTKSLADQFDWARKVLHRDKPPYFRDPLKVAENYVALALNEAEQTIQRYEKGLAAWAELYPLLIELPPCIKPPHCDPSLSPFGFYWKLWLSKDATLRHVCTWVMDDLWPQLEPFGFQRPVFNELPQSTTLHIRMCQKVCTEGFWIDYMIVTVGSACKVVYESRQTSVAVGFDCGEEKADDNS